MYVSPYVRRDGNTPAGKVLCLFLQLACIRFWNIEILKARVRVSFCGQTKTTAMLIQSFSCAFRPLAGQVTRMVR